MVALAVEQQPGQRSHDHQPQNDGAYALAIEGNTQQGYGKHGRNDDALAVGHLVALVNGPDYHGNQQDDINNESGVERHAAGVHEEPLKPSAHLHNTGHYAVEHGCHQHHRDDQSYDGTLGRHVFPLLEVINQHDGGQAQQVEQVYADGKAGQVENQHQPAVAVRLVGTVLPLEDEPEHQGRKHR